MYSSINIGAQENFISFLWILITLMNEQIKNILRNKMEYLQFQEHNQQPRQTFEFQISQQTQPKRKRRRNRRSFAPQEGILVKNRLIQKPIQLEFDDFLQETQSGKLQTIEEQKQMPVQEKAQQQQQYLKQPQLKEQQKKYQEPVDQESYNIFQFYKGEEEQKKQEKQQQAHKDIIVASQPKLELREMTGMEPFQSQSFLNDPIPEGQIVKCVLQRDRGGLGLNLFSTEFHLMFQYSGKHILSAKKKFNSMTPYYHISSNKQQFEPESKSYQGKLKGSNSVQYTLYDKQDKKSNQLLKLNFIKTSVKGPRQIVCQMPYKKSSMIKSGLGLQISAENSYKLVNMKPKWSKSLNSYVLNFNGRVKVASVKNFILTYMNSQEYLLLFGKIDDSFFHLDFTSPFSPIQALAVALSSFDYTGK